MAVNGSAEPRLRIAEAFRESADHSSEGALRDALSRSYYSVFHAALGFLRKDERLGHGGLQRELEKYDKELAEEVRTIYRLRENADYDPRMVERDYGGDLERFRLKVTQSLEQARAVYQRFVLEIQRRAGKGAV